MDEWFNGSMLTCHAMEGYPGEPGRLDAPEGSSAGCRSRPDWHLVGVFGGESKESLKVLIQFDRLVK